MPDSSEMTDFDDINDNDSLNSPEMPNFEETVVSESGLQVLFIYCAHMASKWRPMLNSQPIQGNDMSVEAYYAQFVDWRKKKDEVDYIGGEESYIDDFLYGMKRELAVRIWEYNWKPHTLYGAFRRAEIEETMMKNDADMVLEETPHPNYIDNSIEGFVIEYERQLIPNTGSKGILSCATGVEHSTDDVNKLDEENDGVFLGEMPTCLKATHYMPILSPVDSDEDLYGKYVSPSSFPYNIECSSGDSSSNWVAGPLTNISSIAQDLNYEDVVLGDSVTNFPLSSLLEFSPRVFDPGTLLKHKVYESQLNEIDGHLHCSTWIELNEGYVVDGVVVLSVLDLQATLGLLGDLTVNGSDNGLTKAWHDEATLAIKNAPRKYAIVDEAYKEFGEMTQAIRATLLDEEVTNHYAKYADFNKLILFDPGGNRKFVMSCSREVARPLFGKAQEVFVFGFKAKQNISSEKLGTFEPSMADFQDVAMEMVFREMMVLMIGPGISSLLYEMFQSFQEAQLDDQVLDPYTNGFYFNNRTIFGPGGDIYYALSYENDAVLSLWGNHKTVGQSMGVCFCSILALLHDTDEMQSAGDRHILEINFNFWCNPVGMSEYYDVTMMKILVAILANLVWDPGISAIFVYILEDKDVFKRVGKWIIAIDHKTELMVLLKLRSVRAADFLFKECSSQPSIQQNEGNHVSNIDEEFVQIENFDMFTTDSKEVVVLVRMSFSTHLMKFAQLLSWSPESSKLTVE